MLGVLKFDEEPHGEDSGAACFQRPSRLCSAAFSNFSLNASWFPGDSSCISASAGSLVFFSLCACMCLCEVVGSGELELQTVVNHAGAGS